MGDPSGPVWQQEHLLCFSPHLFISVYIVFNLLPVCMLESQYLNRCGNVPDAISERDKVLRKGSFFPPVDLQSNVHVWKGLSRQTTHCPFSSVCLCVHCTQLDAFVCLIHKTAKSKIVIMLFISLCCQGLFKQTSTLPPITAASLCQPSRRKHTQHHHHDWLQPSLPLWDSPTPPPPIFPSSSHHPLPPLQMVSFPNTLITHHPDEWSYIIPSVVNNPIGKRLSRQHWERDRERETGETRVGSWICFI